MDTHRALRHGTPKRLVLVGMMGSGKTTIGRLLSERTGWPYADNDELVRRTSGREPAEVRATDGEEALHQLESTALVEALRLPPPSLIGAAASVITDEPTVAIIHDSASVVWLRARPETLRLRIGTGEGRRAEATDLTWLAQQAASRETAYTRLADLIIDVDDIPPAETVEVILAWLRAVERPAVESGP
ncbi:MAG: serine transporter [Chloroflexi bacterium]|nr:serine transporter [Chloroflexota bacterium]